MTSHFTWRALGDFPAEIQGDDAIRQPHDERHMVLNEQNGQSAAVAQLTNETCK
jgi:hypothetical protein